MGGPTSIKAFMMVMIGGAGVISGAIWGGIILGFMEAIGLALLYQYGDITYLLNLRFAHDFPSHPTAGPNGQAVGLIGCLDFPTKQLIRRWRFSCSCHLRRRVPLAIGSNRPLGLSSLP